MSTLFDAIDRRLADVFEHGARERLYFLRAKLPRIVEDDGNIIHAPRARYVPITSTVQTELLRLVRNHLRHPLSAAEPPTDARHSRSELTEAIRHRPASRTRGLEL